MALTTKGFQGTISDVDMATQFPGIGGGSVNTPADFAVAAVASARSVTVAAGTAFSGFVKVVNDAAATLTLAPPASGGKWYLVALQRQWSPSNSALLEAVDVGITTDGTVPTAAPAPTTIPTGVRNNPGTAGSTSASGAHQPLAWVHVRAADTTLTIFDARLVSDTIGRAAATTYAAMYLAGLLRPPQLGTVVPIIENSRSWRWNGTAWQLWSADLTGDLSFTSNVVNIGSGRGTTLVREGRNVTLSLMVQINTTIAADFVFLTLPVGARPVQEEQFVVTVYNGNGQNAYSGFAAVQINPDGTVKFKYSPSGSSTAAQFSGTASIAAA